MAVLTINGLGCNPSAMSIGIQDVSASDAGRDQSGTMHKMLITQKQKIELEWWQPQPALVAQILTAVKSEYFSVTYTNPETNSAVTKTMYVGDRSAPYQVWGTGKKRFSKLSFNLIER